MSLFSILGEKQFKIMFLINNKKCYKLEEIIA
jgi:hypothetical protein